MSSVVEKPATRDFTEASINKGLASAAWRSEGPSASGHGDERVDGQTSDKAKAIKI